MITLRGMPPLLWVCPNLPREGAKDHEGSKGSQMTLRLGNNVGRAKLSLLGLEILAKWLWPGHAPTLSLVATHFESLKRLLQGDSKHEPNS